MLETITEIAQIRRCPDVVGPLAAAAADSGGFWLLRARILLCLYGDLSHTRRAPRGKSQPAIGSGWTRLRRWSLGPGRLKVKASCAAGRGSGEGYRQR